jgi:hypothetical protein
MRIWRVAYDLYYGIFWSHWHREHRLEILAGFASRKCLRSLLRVSSYLPEHLQGDADSHIRYFLCPETGGKTLEEVDYLFGDGKLAWKSYNIPRAEQEARAAVWLEKSAGLHLEEHEAE